MVASSAVLLLLALGRAQDSSVCDGTGAAPCEVGYEHHVQLLQQKVKVALKADGDTDEAMLFQTSTKMKQLDC